MSYINPPTPLIQSPVGVDAAIQKIQISLAVELEWLSVCYSKATTGLTRQAGKEYRYPEVFIGGKSYLTLEPNNYLDAHAFFKLEGPQEASEYRAFGYNRYQQKISIIFWMNLDKVKKSMGYHYTHRYTEELKRQILNVLRLHTDFVLSRIYELPFDVFAGYSYNHLDNQTFKHPEAGFKFEGTLSFKENC